MIFVDPLSLAGCIIRCSHQSKSANVTASPSNKDQAIDLVKHLSLFVVKSQTRTKSQNHFQFKLRKFDSYFVA